MRVLYAVIAAAVSTFSLAALLAMTVPASPSEGELTAELGPITVIAVETPPVLAAGDGQGEMKGRGC